MSSPEHAERNISPDSLDGLNPEPHKQNKMTDNSEQNQLASEDTAGKASSQPSQMQDRTRDNYAMLCHLLVEVGPQAMRQVFNNIHPQINLVQTLARPAITVHLRRLRALGLLTPEDWEVLYPQRKSQVNSTNYSPTLLYLLLRNVSPLTAPYPDGWNGLPLQSDTSTSADLVRIQWFRTLLINKKQNGSTDMSDKEYKAYWQQIRDILHRLGGTSIKIKVDRLEREKSPSVIPKHQGPDHVKLLHLWDEKAKEVTAKESRIEKMRNRNGNDMSQLMSDSFSDYASRTNSRKTDRPQTENTMISTAGSTEKNKPIQRDVSRRKSYNFTKEVNTLTKEELRAHERSVLLKFYHQLTEVVQSDDVVPKLIQRSLLSHEEKNRINLATRNSDRMKMVIELVSKKSGNGFDKFCDAIKYKYKKLSDQLVRAKQSPLKLERPDERTQCITALHYTYNNSFKVVSPIPWHPELTVNMKDFLLPYYITDFYGRIVQCNKLFTPHSKCESPKRILLEGYEGVGKSTLLHQLASQWSQGVKGHFVSRFKMVFLLDLKKVTGDLADTLTEQCLGAGGYVRNASELDSVLKADEENVLFLLDGYEDINNIETNIWDLVHRKLYPRSSLIVAANTRFVTSGLLKNFDTHLVLLGIQPDTQEDLVRRYSELTQTSTESYAGLLTKVISEYNTTIRTYSLNPMYGLGLCLISETGGNLDFHTLSYMMNSVVWAIQKLFCQKNNLPISEDSVPDDIKEAVGVLEQLAFEKIMENKLVVSQRDLADATEGKQPLSEVLFKLGILTEVNEIGVQLSEDDKSYLFAHRFIQEFLAARYLSKIDVEKFNSFFDGLVNEKHLHNVATFFCGIHRYNFNLRTLRELFKELAKANRRQFVPSSHSTRDRVYSKDLDARHSEGRMSSLALCLDCIAEAEGRKDILELVQDNFPWRLYMKHRIHHSPQTILGLGQVLKSNMTSICELELRLDNVGSYYDHFYMVLADAIEQATHLVTLKIRWTKEDLLALFLANVFGQNKTLRHLHLTDESYVVQDDVSATVWSNLWSAGNNMHHLQTMAFTQCKNPAMVTSFIRNSPQNLQNCYLNSCKIDLIGAQELSTKIEKNQNLQLLNLSSVKLKRSDFLYLAYGLKLNRSLTELLLCDFQLDDSSANALAEALQFNTTLRRLDLKKATLSTESCRSLGYALGINQSLLEVGLNKAKITQEGARLLHQLKREGVLLVGLDDRRTSIAKVIHESQLHSSVTLPSINS